MVVAQVDKSIGAVLCLIEDINSEEPAPINGAGFFIFKNLEFYRDEIQTSNPLQKTAG